MEVSATAREALIAEFVSQWGFPNVAENADFERDFRVLLVRLGCLPSQNAPRTQEDLQVGVHDHGGDPQGCVRYAKSFCEDSPAGLLLASI